MIEINSITVVDSIMGSGKTSAILNMVNQNPENSYVYVTPYLDEVERVINQTSHRFKQPHNNGEGKLESWHRLLSAGESIVTTHALFLMATSETIQLIHEGGYTLILDEVLDIFKEYNDAVKSYENKTVTKGDVRWLQQEGYITVSQADYGVQWNGAITEDCHYSEVERLARNGTLRCIDDCLFWEYPKEVFTAFNSIYILTYMFESTILSAYMRIYELPYDKVSAERIGDKNFRLCPYTDDTETKKKMFSLVNIYSGNLNSIGKQKNAFSVSWLKGRNSEQIAEIKSYMRRYKEKLKSPSYAVMWTTTKQNDIYKKLERIKGFKYTRQLTAEEQKYSDDENKKLKCFVSCNARATNDYADRTTLLYMLNRFPPVETGKYFSRRGSPIDEDGFATSELLQWIWRSAIRKDNKINLFIPSSRMRKLLYEWFGVNETSYHPRPNKVLEKALL